MQSQVYEKIEHFVNEIKKIDGAIGIILFGSFSRGDYDEGSDIDLLVVFKDKKELDKGLREIYKTTAKTELFFQVIGLTLDELKGSPFLESVLRDGKIYYAKEDVKKLLTPKHRPYALVTYSTANLSPKERVIFTQKLEGRHRGKYSYDGLIQELGGYKVGRGVAMVPLEKLKTLTEHLDKKEIDYIIRYLWA
ncbi:MAG: nucleotidyltransferase domain-containing protein [archaeon]|nr:nucleotidyltransferase domain-containing protein [archaeon]MCP8315161.1 nucleotidyltransferase domain-containing protein [archaeon]MCP8322108.1 nucleotidyltransferase domain-containing protein [archaeon]